jgi:hypothetical protein
LLPEFGHNALDTFEDPSKNPYLGPDGYAWMRAKQESAGESRTDLIQFVTTDQTSFVVAQ